MVRVRRPRWFRRCRSRQVRSAGRNRSRLVIWAGRRRSRLLSWAAHHQSSHLVRIRRVRVRRLVWKVLWVVEVKCRRVLGVRNRSSRSRVGAPMMGREVRRRWTGHPLAVGVLLIDRVNV